MHTNHLRRIHQMSLDGTWFPLETEGLVILTGNQALGKWTTVAAYLEYQGVSSSSPTPVDYKFFDKMGTDSYGTYFQFKPEFLVNGVVRDLALGNNTLGVNCPKKYHDLLEGYKDRSSILEIADSIDDLLSSPMV